MKPLLVLISTFGISLLITKLASGNYQTALSARIAMAAMLLFTAIGHFVFTKGMALMIPEMIPFKTGLVYLTGLLEIAAAIALLIPGLKLPTGWLLICFFILLLPANIYGAIQQLDYQKGTFDGNGIPYLWFRVPLQLLFIVWTYLCTIRF